MDIRSEKTKGFANNLSNSHIIMHMCDILITNISLVYTILDGPTL